MLNSSDTIFTEINQLLKCLYIRNGSNLKHFICELFDVGTSDVGTSELFDVGTSESHKPGKVKNLFS